MENLSREKQIEEIAKILLIDCEGACADCEYYGRYNGSLCIPMRLANELYKQGYRKQEWISVEERLPNPYISVLVYMPGEAPHPTVREGFLTKHGTWYAGGFDRLPDEVVMWKEMPEAPKMKGGAE